MPAKKTRPAPTGLPVKFRKDLIGKYLKDDALKGRFAWPREMKLINQLVETYKDEAFWRWYNPGFKLNSLAWFLGDGAPALKQAHVAFLFDCATKTRKVSPIESTEPIIEPKPLKIKPRSIAEWLRKK